MPWVWQERNEKRRHTSDKEAGEWADCSVCLHKTPRWTRAFYGCGFLPAAERAARPNLQPTNRRTPEATVCVGYSTALPQVREAARALVWRRAGELGLFYDGQALPEPAKEAIDTLDSELKWCEVITREDEVAERERKRGTHV